MSIIISVEREGVRNTPLGMKEMKEIKIYSEMLDMVLNNCFWEVMDARTYFLNELMYSDFMIYTHDNCQDNNKLIELVSHNDSDYSAYVSPAVAEKVGNYYKATHELMRDIRFYLYKNYGINYNKELEKRKAKRNAKKEG